jgi:hypothetical protein
VSHSGTPLSKVSEAVLSAAKRIAARCGMDFVGTDCLLLALASSPGTAARRLLTDIFHITEQQVLANTLAELPLGQEFKQEILQKGFSELPAHRRSIHRTPRLQQVLSGAGDLATRLQARFVSTDMLLQGLCEARDGVALRALARMRIDPTEIARRARDANLLESYVDAATGNETQIVITIDEGRLAVQHYAPLGLYRVPLSPGHEIILKPGRATRTGFFGLDQIGELEELVNNRETTEPDLQRFFEKNPDFLRFHEHSQVYPQIQLKADEGDALIPDFFLLGLKGNLDICDIKLPSVKLTAGRRSRRRFSAAVFDGVAQLRTYGSYFDDPQNRTRFFQELGLECYRPRLFLVIGRSRDFNSSFERRNCELDFSDVEVITYDDLLRVARERSVTDLR